jgi:hypothetical protein
MAFELVSRVARRGTGSWLTCRFLRLDNASARVPTAMQMV